MSYLFLTGATGLLGSYLIRDLSRRGVKLAVLVRPTRFASAQHRIESSVARWEKQAGHAIERPVVFEGDLSKPDLGLDAASRSWVAQNCGALMHNAASLTFQAESPESEPWRSNLHGTSHVLQFVKSVGIREFHHVSTAYVCGQRRDRVLESELDVGQKHGNDYEISKFQSETMVREADCLDSVTVYRPGIILGDSKTGYTSTYHGFYVPLKLVASLTMKSAAASASPEAAEQGIRMAGARLQTILQLDGKESKNFVPVDWVSEMMARVYVDPKLHNDTYHLTPRSRVPVQLFQSVMEEVILKYTLQHREELKGQNPAAKVDWAEFEQFFLEGMGVYRSYWGDDPLFDDANTRRAAPDLPCPELDEEMFTMMCRFAIESNFGWPREPALKLQFDVHKHLQDLTDLAAKPKSEGDTFLGLQVNGQGGGQWELALRDGQIVSASQGLSERCTATYYLNSNTFEKLATRQSNVNQLINTGSVLIEGNGVPLGKLADILQGVAARPHEQPKQS